jgi:hypothetical protein
MALDAGAVIGRLDMNIEGWKKSVETVKKDQQSLTGLALRHDKGIKDLGKTLSIAGATITATFGALIKKSADAGEAVYNLSKKYGISTEILSSYKLGLEQSGSSLDGFAMGMKGLTNLMDSANRGNKDAIGLFKDLGVSFRNADGSLRPLNDVFLDVADRLSQMPDGTQKASLSMAVFGDRIGTELIPFLNLGKKGIEDVADRSRKLGLVWSGTSAKAAADFNDSLAELKGGLEGTGIQIGTVLMPAVKGLIEKVIGIVVKVREWAAENPGLAKWLGETAIKAGLLMSTLGPIIYALPGLIKGWKEFKLLALNPITIAIIGFSHIAKDIADGIADWKRYKDAGWAAMEALKQKAGSFNPFKVPSFEALYRLGEYMERAQKEGLNLKGAMSLLGDAFQAIKEKIETGIINPIISLSPIFKNFGLKTKTELTAELTAAEAALELLKGSAERTPGAIKEMEDKIAGLKEQLTGVKSATVAWVEYLKNIGVTTIKEKKDRVAELWKILGDLDAQYKIGKITQDDYAKATKAAKGEISALSSELIKGTLPAGRDLSTVLQLAVPRFRDTAYAAWTFEGALKDVANQAMVSEATVLQFLWNARADFLSTIGIIVPKIESLAPSTEATTKTMGQYFDGLMNDIASGFGNTIQSWLEGATTFRDFMKGMWGDIKGAFFRVVGEMVAKWAVGLIQPLTASAAATGASITASLGSGIAAIGSGLAGLVTSLIGILPAMATAIASAATILAAAAPAILVAGAIALALYGGFKLLGSIFSSGGSGAGDGMGRVVERQDKQLAILQSLIDFCRNNIGPALLDYGVGYMAKTMDAANQAVGWLQTINSTLAGLKGASAGLVSTQTEMVMVHGTPSDPEYIVRASQIASGVGIAAHPQVVQAPTYLTTQLVLDGKILDERTVRIANGRVEWLHQQYRRGQRFIPATSIGGA